MSAGPFKQDIGAEGAPAHSLWILAMDLSCAHGHLALCEGKRLVGQEAFSGDRSHHGALFAPLQRLLGLIPSEARVQLVVGIGPGSYTGVRIAIAAAQGLGLARGWPLLGLPSIASAGHDRYGVVGDARRGQAYLAQVSDGHLLGQPLLLEPQVAASMMTASQPWLSFDAQVPFGLAGVELARPDAQRLAKIVASMSASERGVLNAGPLQPYYLQEAFITQAKGRGKTLQG